MMLPTHILAGGSLGLLMSILSPEIQLILVLTGMIAGILPDLDMFFEHKRTLHRPIQFSLLLIISAGLYVATGWISLLTLSSFFGSITLHTVSDIFGQGKTMNSDLKEDDRCIYNHLNGEWIEPMRVIKVGSLKDLCLSFILSIPLVATRNYLIISIALVFLSAGLLQYLLTDWITRNLLSEYDRFSEAIQQKIGYGPEVQN